jgi:hypothetical protein
MINSNFLKELYWIGIVITMHHSYSSFLWVNLILNPIFGNMWYGGIEPTKKGPSYSNIKFNLHKRNH